QVSGTYTITSTGGLDTTVALYSSTYAQITFDDDTGAGLNFSITRTFSAGTTYYLAFSLYGTSSGSFTVNLSKLN
ncbi:MAG TPA: tyrosinase/peptidase, partial [Bacillota bacterium]|nr:tyrosinase/peptidase [Bacillota bacterium]